MSFCSLPASVGQIDRHTLTVAMVRFAKNLKGPIAKTWQTEPATPHDLRRTVNTRLAKLGVAKEVRDRTLNHITALRDPESRHYNVHEFRAEKRAALSRWAEEIESIIAPVVVPIHKGRRR